MEEGPSINAIRFRSWQEAEKADRAEPGVIWRWPNFTPKEMADRQSGELVIVPYFMNWLQGLRTEFGRAMVVTSGYRTSTHQQSIDGRSTGAHVDGMAADIRIANPFAHDLARLAFNMGALGVGVHQDPATPREERYIHLDLWMRAPTGARPALWSYARSTSALDALASAA